MEDINIRFAKSSDITNIQDFQVKMEHTIEEHPSPDETGKAGAKYILENPDEGFYLVAGFGDKIVGCLRISFERSVSNNGYYWWIQNVFVEDEYRGKGIFKYLFDRVIDLAKKKENVVTVKLHVHTNNPRAIKAYEKAGMIRSPEYPYIFNIK